MHTYHHFTNNFEYFLLLAFLFSVRIARARSHEIHALLYFYFILFFFSQSEKKRERERNCNNKSLCIMIGREIGTHANNRIISNKDKNTVYRTAVAVAVAAARRRRYHHQVNIFTCTLTRLRQSFCTFKWLQDISYTTDKSKQNKSSLSPSYTHT